MEDEHSKQTCRQAASLTARNPEAGPSTPFVRPLPTRQFERFGGQGITPTPLMPSTTKALAQGRPPAAILDVRNNAGARGIKVVKISATASGCCSSNRATSRASNGCPHGTWWRITWAAKRRAQLAPALGEFARLPNDGLAAARGAQVGHGGLPSPPVPGLAGVRGRPSSRSGNYTSAHPPPDWRNSAVRWCDTCSSHCRPGKIPALASDRGASGSCLSTLPPYATQRLPTDHRPRPHNTEWAVQEAGATGGKRVLY